MDQHQLLPHVLIFPLPIQSPVNSMMQLAELLCLAGIRVTFLITKYNHKRLLRCTDIQTRCAGYHGLLQLETIEDGLPEDDPRNVEKFAEIMDSLQTVAQPFLREFLQGCKTPITCVIAEGFYYYALDITEELGIPLIFFETISPCCLWVYFCLTKLMEAGQLHFKGDDLDTLVTSIPGMEGVLRFRDLPDFCRRDYSLDGNARLVFKSIQAYPRAAGLILNSFAELESPVSSHLRSDVPHGPVNCMLKLAELFCLEEIHVTFINTEYIQDRLRSFSDAEPRFKRYPNFRFETIPDGLPDGAPRTGDGLVKLWLSMEAVSLPILTEMLTSGSFGPNSENPATCFIADGFFSFVCDMAKEIKLPLIYFDTVSPCGLWTYLCLPKLIDAGEFPFKDNDLDAPVKNVEEMECVMRRRDLPSFYRLNSVDEILIQLLLKEDEQLPRAEALIFNTFEELDKGTLNLMRTLGPKVYAVGPIHTLLKSRLPEVSYHSLWKEDKSCIQWLNKQPSKSVIYVSIGSLATMTKDQLMEIWYGLVNSGFRFLWVHREGSIMGLNNKEDEIPEELAQATKERGCIVSWAPQEEVLGHPGIGGFLTHSGWNSTLESIVEGVPMIGWPYFVDQQVNSRYVSEVWKLGLDMKDTCDRVIVEKMVRDLMNVRRDELLERAGEMANLAKSSVRQGGSSYNDLVRLVEDIKLTRFK
ncbi:OLC1v1026677C1 [Oldenlandia corymbosa var. corymbosa]|uniref:OLC1v1026677C1 n=1 Tax=Oldenlandia corymbosa var. corymbosa TaxID=529605 RepID=A0AAV1C9M6_OLDCO|nr:OLC1v1026677C1 [Oldenlandia corymbosa var. corymbosa]